jgi:hypothetical protein
MLKKYKVGYFPNAWDCIVAIDENFVIKDLSKDQLALTKNAIITMVEFWQGWQERLALNDGYYLPTFLQQLAKEIVFMLAKDRNATLETIKFQFYNLEGWCPMDGTYGIHILTVDEFELEANAFDVEEI